MANLQQFEQMIGQLMASENTLRGQAEAAFNEAKKSPDALVVSLVQLIRGSQHEQIRALSCVLLRRVTGRGSQSLLPVLQPDTVGIMKSQLLESIETEKSVHVRNKLADSVSEIASILIEKSQWNELLPFLFKCTKSPEPTHREISLSIFAQLAPDLGVKMRPHFALLKDILLAGLNDPSSLKVRIAALAATANFLQVLTEHHERQQFQQLTGAMLGCISSALNAQQEEEARSALELFVDLAELDPTFLRPALDTIVPAMQVIATAQQLEDATKQLGVEFLVTLAESKPGMTRKQKNYVEVLIPIILNMMLDLEDNDSWNSGDDGDVDITNSDVGEESLDRLALALGGKTIVPILFNVLPSLFNNPDWKHRHTALMALSIIGEGCSKTLLPNLRDVVKNILPFFRDPHPRVRWAACNTAGQMSTDFGPDFQNQFHEDILPPLIALMDDTDNPRVQSHAASAVINFCEHATTETISPYLERLLSKLIVLLHSGKTIVQEQVVTAIAAIADCARSSFVQYYDNVVPYLKNILSNANTKEYRTLRGKAMECITLIGVAVGKEKFYNDAKEIMELMLRTQTTTLDPDDPQISFLLQAWARICRCLGKDFVPYLGYVMPPLLHSAKISPDVTVTENNNGEEQPEGWDFIPVGDKRIGINTSALEEKATACNMLFCYASELQEGFFPYVDEVAKLLVPLMRFYYHDGVRSAAVSTMPRLLVSAAEYMQSQGAAKGADATYVRSLFNFMFPTMIESLKEEIDTDLLVSSIGSFTECIDAVGDNCLDDAQFKQTLELIISLLADIQTRREKREKEKREEDHDEEEEERVLDEEEMDEEVTSQLSELIGHLAMHQKNNFFSFFEQLIPTLLELLNPVRPASDRQSALCIWDDVVDFQKQASVRYFEPFIPRVISYIGDPDPAVRQAAVYGIGSACEFGGPAIAPLVPEILSRLSQVITLPDARKDPFTNPTENAIAAVGKICVHQGSATDLSSILPTWLSWLPVTSDKVESRVTYNQLCTFVETSNPHILGQGYQNVPKIVSIFAHVLDTDLIDEDITKRIVNILKQMQSGLPANLLQNAFSALSPQNQQKLVQKLSS